MPSLAEPRTVGPARPKLPPLRPPVPSYSLRGQFAGLLAHQVDANPVEFLALALVFLCVFSSLSTAIAALGLLVFFLLIFARGLNGALALGRSGWLLAYPMLLIASTAWSPDPAVTARYSVQVLLTGLIGLYSGLFMSRLDGLKLYFLTCAVLIMASIISGRQGSSADGSVLVGLLGSKNSLALTAQSLVQAGLALALVRGRLLWRIAGLLMTPIGVYLVLASHATTSVLCLAIGLPLVVVLRAGALLGRPKRLLLLGGAALLLALIFPLRDDLNRLMQDFTFNVLHKDATLTGRTILWDHAREFIRQRPWLGWGYKEAWLGSGGDSTGLLRWAGLLDGRGFFFHQTWLEAQVDVGYVGLALLIFIWSVTGLVMLGGYVRAVRPDAALEFGIITYIILTLSSFSETTIQPFSSQVALLTTMAVWGWGTFQDG